MRSVAGIPRPLVAELIVCVGSGAGRTGGPIGGAATDVGAAERDPAELPIRLPGALFRRAHWRVGGSELPATERRERFPALPAGAVGHRRRQRTHDRPAPPARAGRRRRAVPLRPRERLPRRRFRCRQEALFCARPAARISRVTAMACRSAAGRQLAAWRRTGARCRRVARKHWHPHGRNVAWSRPSHAPHVPEIRSGRLDHARSGCCDRRCGSGMCRAVCTAPSRTRAGGSPAPSHRAPPAVDASTKRRVSTSIVVVLVPAEPCGRSQAADLAVLDRRETDRRGRPGVQDRPAALLHRLARRAALHHRAPVGRHHLHVHADLHQQVVGHVAQRTHRGQVGRIEQHRPSRRCSRTPAASPSPWRCRPASPRRRPPDRSGCRTGTSTRRCA